MAHDPHHDQIARGMLEEYIREVVADSRDTSAEVIREVNGRMSVKRIDLKEFDWAEYPTIVALSFTLDVAGGPNIRHLFSPKYASWQTSCDCAEKPA